LNIEVGRQKGHTREKGICSSCNLNAIEDENHFILHCQKFTKERILFFKELGGINPDFISFSEE